MKALFTLLMSIVPMLIDRIVSELSPELRNMIVNTIAALDDKAKKTKNPFDDIAVGALKSVFQHWIK